MTPLDFTLAATHDPDSVPATLRPLSTLDLALAIADAGPTRPESPATPQSHPGPLHPPPSRSFPAVGLDELNNEAENLTRQDRKYIVALKDIPGLLRALPRGARILDIAGAQHFPYASTYLDTLELDSFYDAAHRRRRRFKVRIRRYSDGAEFLEVKTRGERGLTVKERIPFDCDLPLSYESAAFVSETFARARIHEPSPADLWPSLRTTYTRTTFLLPDAGARLTLDTDLAFRPLHIDAASRERRAHLPVRGTVELGPVAIVETKALAATKADRALWRRGYRPTRISKYATGVILTSDHLRAGRWHRTLTHHIPDALSA